MDRRVLELLRIVGEINKRGGELAFRLNKNGFEISDNANKCRDILYDTDYRNAVLYFEKWFEEQYEICIDMYFEELNYRLEVLENGSL